MTYVAFDTNEVTIRHDQQMKHVSEDDSSSAMTSPQPIDIDRQEEEEEDEEEQGTTESDFLSAQTSVAASPGPLSPQRPTSIYSSSPIHIISQSIDHDPFTEKQEDIQKEDIQQEDIQKEEGAEEDDFGDFGGFEGPAEETVTTQMTTSTTCNSIYFIHYTEIIPSQRRRKQAFL